MATAYRRKNDGALVAQYKGADGKQHQERLDAKEYRTLRDAKRRAQELEDAALAQSALVEGKIGKAATFANLIDWWDWNYAAKSRLFTEVGFLKKHVLPELGAKKVAEVTAGVIEGFLVKKEALGPDGQPQLKAKSINNLRELIGRVFSKAIEQEMWRAPNPIDKVPRRKVKKKKNLAVLTPEEAKALLYALDARWRGIVATALLLALRKGESLGMLKDDVDSGPPRAQRHSQLRVRLDEGQPGGHAPHPRDARPVPRGRDCCVTERVRLPEPERRDVPTGHEAEPGGAARAGARRRGHRIRPRVPSPGVRRQGQAAGPGAASMPRVQDEALAARQFRSGPGSTTSATTATLLLRAGVDSTGCSGSSATTTSTPTEDTYSHLDVEDLRAAISTLPAPPTGAGLPPRVTTRARGARRVSEVAGPPPAANPEKRRPAGADGFPSDLRAFDVGETGFEPATPWSRTKCSTRLSHSPMLRPSAAWPRSRADLGPT